MNVHTYAVLDSRIDDRMRGYLGIKQSAVLLLQSGLAFYYDIFR